MTYTARVQLPALASPAHEVWHVLLDLAETTTAPWTLVGGQMVLLHALERGVEPPQISQDGDVVGDVRSDQQALRKLVDARRRIRQGAALRDPAHRAWTLVPQRLRRDGHDTFDVLTAAPQPR